jgi:hypothetical protein
MSTYGWLNYGADEFPALDEQARENRKRTLQSFVREYGADPSWRYIARPAVVPGKSLKRREVPPI